MIEFLKDHPFAVEAFFKSSIVLTFAVPKEELEPLVPECLELDVFNNETAFIAMALVQTRNLRPKGLPKMFGSDFFLVGYRVFVRYITKGGKRLRGLYILKSQTDKKRMEFFGNIFTHYNYTTTDISLMATDHTTTIVSKKSEFEIEIVEGDDTIALPGTSPFKDWAEARRFAGPLPFTFTYNPQTKDVLIIEGVRQNWKPRPLTVAKQSIAYLRSLNFKEITLANAFIVNNIPYYWKKGRKEQWNG